MYELGKVQSKTHHAHLIPSTFYHCSESCGDGWTWMTTWRRSQSAGLEVA